MWNSQEWLFSLHFLKWKKKCTKESSHIPVNKSYIFSPLSLIGVKCPGMHFFKWKKNVMKSFHLKDGPVYILDILVLVWNTKKYGTKILWNSSFLTIKKLHYSRLSNNRISLLIYFTAMLSDTMHVVKYYLLLIIIFSCLPSTALIWQTLLFDCRE